MHQDDPLRRTLADLTDRIQEEVAIHVEALTARVAEAERRGHETGRREAAALGRDRSERLVKAMNALDEAPSLSTVLDALADAAAREAPRVAVLIVRGARLESWRLVNFDRTPDADQTLDLAVGDGGILADAVRTADVAFLGTGGTAPSFAALPEGRRAVAIPLTLAGHVVALVYADDTAADVSRSGQGEGDDREWSASLQVIARHAARCLESVTALQTARFVADQTGWPGHAAAGAEPSSVPEARGASGADEEQAAWRYARLLVSEIRLYHEPVIAEGRRERDLLTRLGGEIARAQALYEQRVPDSIRRSTDFFRAELVRTLADGNPELLGN